MEGGEHVSGARLLGRFGIGAATLAGERLIAVLRMLDARLAGDGAPAPDALELRHALLGALLALPRSMRTALVRGQAAAQPLRGAIRRGHGMVSRLPGARRARRRYDELRARTAAQLERWAADGRREEAAGRALAAATTRAAAEALVSAVADSPDLKRVIAEQSESLGASAITELREGTARADALVERVAGRFLRRAR